MDSHLFHSNIHRSFERARNIQLEKIYDLDALHDLVINDNFPAELDAKREGLFREVCKLQKMADLHKGNITFREATLATYPSGPILETLLVLDGEVNALMDVCTTLDVESVERTERVRRFLAGRHWKSNELAALEASRENEIQKHQKMQAELLKIKKEVAELYFCQYYWQRKKEI